VNGAACAANAQCKSAYCAIDPQSACGYCAPLPKPGDLCDDERQCGPTGLICVKATQRCAQPKGPGEDCDKEEPCLLGYSCVGSGPGEKGICQPEGKEVGAPCDPKRIAAADCDHAQAFYCDPLTFACAEVLFAHPGEPCGVKPGAVVACDKGGLCDPVNLICVAPAADGAPCDRVVGPPCLPPARCVASSPVASGGVCALPDPVACK
jgi:hypothetical protein